MFKKKHFKIKKTEYQNRFNFNLIKIISHTENINMYI